MITPVALYIKKTDIGFDLIVKTLNDAVEHSVNTENITSTTKAYNLFDFLKKKAQNNPGYDIQYISDNIL